MLIHISNIIHPQINTYDINVYLSTSTNYEYLNYLLTLKLISINKFSVLPELPNYIEDLYVYIISNKLIDDKYYYDIQDIIDIVYDESIECIDNLEDMNIKIYISNIVKDENETKINLNNLEYFIDEENIIIPVSPPL